MSRRRVYALVGPTAVGKTALSLGVAEILGAEILSCDSRQIYRRLDVGTAKPSRETLEQVRHHFIDELDLHQSWSAGAFSEAAEERIAEIHDRGHETLVVGGSTLYLHALAHGLARLPEPDLAIRAHLNRIATTEAGRLSLFEELTRIDPEAAATLDPTKSQRLVRFVEIYRSTGRPASAFWKDVRPPVYDVRVVVLDRPRDELYARIEARVDAMLSTGLLAEVESLRGYGFSRETTPSLRTIGYQEVLAHLEGEVEYGEMVERLKRNTRRYAKRQLTWFRRRPEYTWRPAEASPRDVLAAFE
ncbi:MAG: tRNA (adenosine(37)-N6)-dimethylallyltransferase MiaA [Bacteroidota bacterium]